MRRLLIRVSLCIVTSFLVYVKILIMYEENHLDEIRSLMKRGYSFWDAKAYVAYRHTPDWLS